MYSSPTGLRPKFNYPAVYKNGRYTCWNCGKFRNKSRQCKYCNDRPDDKDLHRYTTRTAWAARDMDILKSELVDHATQHVPCP